MPSPFDLDSCFSRSLHDRAQDSVGPCGHRGWGWRGELASRTAAPGPQSPPGTQSLHLPNGLENSPPGRLPTDARRRSRTLPGLGALGTRGARASAAVSEASSLGPAPTQGPVPTSRTESARAHRKGRVGGTAAGDCPVPQRPPRQQALTWPPSEPPSCGSETNACLRAASAPRPPRVRLGWGRGGGGGRVEARREAEPGR